MTTIKWNKLPSVTRPGKSFYRTEIKGTSWTVMQSWVSGLWNITNNHNGMLAQQDHKTAKAAMRSVETYNRCHVL